MLSSAELVKLFFNDLKSYNSTNFRTLENADLTQADATVHKAFSSVVTRYFIFAERHPEISTEDMRILYFKLKIDMVGRYFSEYPDINLDLLKGFQLELFKYLQDKRGAENGSDATTLQDLKLETA